MVKLNSIHMCFSANVEGLTQVTCQVINMTCEVSVMFTHVSSFISYDSMYQTYGTISLSLIKPGVLCLSLSLVCILLYTGSSAWTGTFAILSNTVGFKYLLNEWNVYDEVKC